jgi:hypothetical protein
MYGWEKDLFHIYHSISGEVESVVVFGRLGSRACYLFGANDHKIDMEGINNPARGNFKHSFGGEIVPNYSMHLDQQVQL